MIKRIMFPVIMLIISVFCLNAEDVTGLELQYKCVRKDSSATSISSQFNIVNKTALDIPLSKLAIRYYFTMEDPASEQVFHCYYAAVGNSNVKGAFVNTGENNYYLEISFTESAGTLAAGRKTGEIQSDFNKKNWSGYNQADDYSFNPEMTGFANWKQVTLHYSGDIVWGKAPGEESVPPTVSITSPSSSDTFTEGETVTITADAADEDGSVSLVEFLVNGKKVGEDSEEPYEINWVAAYSSAAGEVLTCRAADNEGNTTLSSSVTIQVELSKPRVLLTAPVDGASFAVGDGITLKAAVKYPDSISGEMTIGKVEFFANKTKIGESASAPYEYEWTDVKAGSYTLFARGIDGNGDYYSSGSAAITVSDPAASNLKVQYSCLETSSSTDAVRAELNIVNLDKADSVSLEELALRYYFTLEGNKVPQFTCDSAAIGTQNIKGTFVKVEDSEYYVEITGTKGTIAASGESGVIRFRLSSTDGTEFDQSNDRSFNAYVTSLTDWTKVELYRKGIKVWPKSKSGNKAPVVSITAPADKDTIPEGTAVEVTVSASDSDGSLTIVELLLDSAVQKVFSAPPYTLKLSNLTTGTYSLEAKATDDTDTTTTSEALSFSIVPDTNKAPTVKITAPAANSEFETGTSVTITADAEDTDGTVAKVVFYAGTTKLGEDSTAPYSIDWVFSASGTYSLTAAATDNKGKSAVSDAVKIIIKGKDIELPYSKLIRLNQAGYKPDDTYKTAVIAGKSGTFTIHTLTGDKLVFTGSTSSLGSDSAKGETLYLADFSSLKTEGSYYLKIGSEKSSKFDIKADLYNEVLYYTLRVYGANRCGDYDSWIHKACHTKDGSIRGADKAGSLTGGWHDCGDHVKFGNTVGYAADMLLYSYTAWPEKFGDVYSMKYDGTYRNPSPDGIPDVVNEAKVGTDYILNLYNASVEDGLTGSNKMYYQVGDGDEDHTWWHKPEYQDAFPQAKGGPDREVWSDIGSDIAGRFSAALAMMYSAYKGFDADYADKCLAAAKAIYKIGANVYGNGGDSGGKGYYRADGRMDDDMAFAAIMLYRATNDEYYINNTTGAAYWMHVENKWEFISYHVLSYPNIFSLALHAYYPYAPTEDGDGSSASTKVVTKAECVKWLKKEAETTSQINDLYGRKWKYDWGTCRYMMGVGSSAVLAHDLDRNDSAMIKIAKDQMNWVLGRNQFGLSFVVGNKDDQWLTKYPQSPHHRAANPEGKNVPSLDDYEATELTGATIGGPESHTAFTDDWERYQSTETGIDYWAGTFFVASYFAK